MTQLDSFRVKLEELQKKGVDIDPQKLTEEIIDAQKRFAEDQEKLTQEEQDQNLFYLVKEKVDNLLEDFFNHYRSKGRKLRVAVEIVKEDCADKFGEKFVYSDKMEVISVIGIGTKGKYEKIGE